MFDSKILQTIFGPKKETKKGQGVTTKSNQIRNTGFNKSNTVSHILVKKDTYEEQITK